MGSKITAKIGVRKVCGACMIEIINKHFYWALLLHKRSEFVHKDCFEKNEAGFKHLYANSIVNGSKKILKYRRKTVKGACHVR